MGVIFFPPQLVFLLLNRKPVLGGQDPCPISDTE